MQTRKFTSRFDYTKGHGKSVTSYDPKGGPNKDGTYEVSDEVAKAADAAVAVEAPKAPAKVTGDGGTGGTGGTGGANK